jgi:hypothetical protein
MTGDVLTDPRLFVRVTGQSNDPSAIVFVQFFGAVLLVTGMIA